MPEDDGAADHLLGQMLPQLTLESSQGPVSLRALSMNRLVLYIYPRTGAPDSPPARTGTPFPARAAARRSRAPSATTPPSSTSSERAVAGLSAQPLDEQVEFAERNHIPYPVIADPERKLGAALRLPTFDVRRNDAVQADHARRRGVRGREGLLPGLPAGPERGRRRRLVRGTR